MDVPCGTGHSQERRSSGRNPSDYHLYLSQASCLEMFRNESFFQLTSYTRMVGKGVFRVMALRRALRADK